MEQGSETFYCDENTFTNTCKFMTTLGRGATAAVKLAFHMPTLTYVAVKITANMKRYSAQNINEADIIKSLVHPNIIQLFQEVQTRDMTYLIMEYASNGDLLRHIRRPGGIQVCEARRLFTQVLQAVKYCHENNVVHRDIKASNILLDSTGNAKLCDFGMAVKLVPGNKLKNFCGTLAYCAPEIFGVEPYDGYASDVWALGVLLYFMVARRVPFKATSSWDLRQQIMAANFNVPPHVPIDIFNVIVELLLISPDRRPTIHQILTRPMIRDSQAQASSIQSLPGTPSPDIVGTITGMGCEPGGMIECLGDQKHNQAMATYLRPQHRSPRVHSCHHQVKPENSVQPGLVLNLADLHTFSGTLRRATEPTLPTSIMPSEPQEEENEKNSRQGGRRHSVPATLCCQPRRIHLAHLSHLRCPMADSILSSSLDTSENSSLWGSVGQSAAEIPQFLPRDKIGLCGSLMAGAQPSCSRYPPLRADQNEAADDKGDNIASCSSPEKLWSSLEMAPWVTPKGSSLGDTLQEVTILQEVTTRHEEVITHGQPQDAGPASSRNRRHRHRHRHRWKRVKKTIVNGLRHLCCCLPPAERDHENQAPQRGDPGDNHRTSPEEVEPQLRGF